jgi:hypothetical protein
LAEAYAPVTRFSHFAFVESKKSPTYSWANSIGIGATPLEEVLFVDSKERDSKQLCKLDKRTGSLRAYQPSSKRFFMPPGLLRGLITRATNAD